MSKKEILSTLAVGVIFLISLVGLYWVLRGIDITALFRRFDYVSLIEAGEQRVVGRALAGIPLFLQEILIGNPGIYPLYQTGELHPHNLLISMWRFTGVLPFIIFLIFIALLFSYRFYINKNLITKKERTELFIIVSAFSIIFIYTMFSGHFTRSWHLYWTAGLLSAYLEGIKSKQKYIERRR